MNTKNPETALGKVHAIAQRIIEAKVIEMNAQNAITALNPFRYWGSAGMTAEQHSAIKAAIAVLDTLTAENSQLHVINSIMKDKIV